MQSVKSGWQALQLYFNAAVVAIIKNFNEFVPAMEEVPSEASKCFIFMYFLLPRCLRQGTGGCRQLESRIVVWETIHVEHFTSISNSSTF